MIAIFSICFQFRTSRWIILELDRQMHAVTGNDLPSRRLWLFGTSRDRLAQLKDTVRHVKFREAYTYVAILMQLGGSPTPYLFEILLMKFRTWFLRICAEPKFTPRCWRSQVSPIFQHSRSFLHFPIVSYPNHVQRRFKCRLHQMCRIQIRSCSCTSSLSSGANSLTQVSWNKRELLLFANSIGVQPNELHFLYELRKSPYPLLNNTPVDHLF